MTPWSAADITAVGWRMARAPSSIRFRGQPQSAVAGRSRHDFAAPVVRRARAWLARNQAGSLFRPSARVRSGWSPRSSRPGRVALKCEEGDLNPKLLAKILRLFAGPTAKNRHLPPRTVSGGHICVAPGADVTCG
jgi:hypothetical protein